MREWSLLPGTSFLETRIDPHQPSNPATSGWFTWQSTGNPVKSTENAGARRVLPADLHLAGGVSRGDVTAPAPMAPRHQRPGTLTVVLVRKTPSNTGNPPIQAPFASPSIPIISSRRGSRLPPALATSETPKAIFIARTPPRGRARPTAGSDRGSFLARSNLIRWAGLLIGNVYPAFVFVGRNREAYSPACGNFCGRSFLEGVYGIILMTPNATSYQ